ncbi:MAG: RluA family pseudouridine synthase [Pseudomonadota bacterium]
MPTQTIQDTDGEQRFDRWLRQQLGAVPQAIIEKWARKGLLRLDGKRVKPAARVKSGQVATFPEFSPATEIQEPVVQSRVMRADRALIRNSVLYQDDQLIALNKPAGLATQGGSKTIRHVDALLDVLAGQEQERPRLVHRLDKDTSGVLLLARTRQAARWLTQGFKDKRFEKTYQAVVVGIPHKAEGLIDAPISKQPGRMGEKMRIDEQDAKPAQTRYRVLKTFEKQNLSLLELQPLTGRTHQLRVHCMHLGTPVLGDGKYGGKSAHPFDKRSLLHLHACKIVVPYTTGEARTFAAPLPEHMRKTLENLEK